MDARLATWIEGIVDAGAAACLAGAAGYLAFRFGSSLATLCALVAAVLLGGWLGLRTVGHGPATFVLGPFAVAPFLVGEECDELVLTESDRLRDSASSEAPDELLLDDVLAKLEDFSRVVRLFDRSAMPTPGELKNRIDQHLDRSPALDASQALHDALSELRRSLR